MSENLIVLVLILGVFLLASVYAVQTRLDKRNVEAMMDQTLAFMKTQCIRYDNFQASNETKSLVRLIDKTEEFSRCLGRQDEASTESLKYYATEQKLAGLIILDENQKVACEYNSDGGGYAAWEAVIQD
ncbi:MAG: hypothetical protein Q4C66_09480, partial [Lachnospiraceae bacterium]|nr:hypothetical protein [Lachnospiraceae bacterium]